MTTKAIALPDSVRLDQVHHLPSGNCVVVFVCAGSAVVSLMLDPETREQLRDELTPQPESHGERRVRL